MEKILNSLKFSLKDAISDRDWMLKTNQQQEKEIYTEFDFRFIDGEIKGLNLAIRTVENRIKDIELSAKVNESMDNMMSLLDRMNNIIDKHT